MMENIEVRCQTYLTVTYYKQMKVLSNLLDGGLEFLSDGLRDEGAKEADDPGG